MMSQPNMKQFTTTGNPINRPISALQPLVVLIIYQKSIKNTKYVKDSQPNKFNMMQKLPSEAAEARTQAQTTKTSQKNIRKLPIGWPITILTYYIPNNCF